jgi:hypothetical protein
MSCFGTVFLSVCFVDFLIDVEMWEIVGFWVIVVWLLTDCWEFGERCFVDFLDLRKRFLIVTYKGNVGFYVWKSLDVGKYIM